MSATRPAEPDDSELMLIEETVRAAIHERSIREQRAVADLRNRRLKVPPDESPNRTAPVGPSGETEQRLESIAAELSTSEQPLYCVYALAALSFYGPESARKPPPASRVRALERYIKQSQKIDSLREAWLEPGGANGAARDGDRRPSSLLDPMVLVFCSLRPHDPDERGSGAVRAWFGVDELKRRGIIPYLNQVFKKLEAINGLRYQTCFAREERLDEPATAKPDWMIQPLELLATEVVGVLTEPPPKLELTPDQEICVGINAPGDESAAIEGELSATITLQTRETGGQRKPAQLSELPPGTYYVMNAREPGAIRKSSPSDTRKFCSGDRIVVHVREKDIQVRYGPKNHNLTLDPTGPEGVVTIRGISPSGLQASLTLTIETSNSGWDQAPKRFHLKEWDPSDEDLWTWLAKAIKGQATKKIGADRTPLDLQINAFRSSLLFPILARGSWGLPHLRVLSNIEFTRCDYDLAGSTRRCRFDQAVRSGHMKKGERPDGFYGNACRCKRRGQVDDRRELKDHFAAKFEGRLNYKRAKRRRGPEDCPQKKDCPKIFPSNLRMCSRGDCNRKLSSREITIWERIDDPASFFQPRHESMDSENPAAQMASICDTDSIDYLNENGIDQAFSDWAALRRDLADPDARRSLRIERLIELLTLSRLPDDLFAKLSDELEARLKKLTVDKAGAKKMLGPKIEMLRDPLTHDRYQRLRHILGLE